MKTSPMKTHSLFPGLHAGLLMALTLALIGLVSVENTNAQIYVASANGSNPNRVAKYNLNGTPDGTFTTTASPFPYDVTTDGAGNLYVANLNPGLIEKYNGTTGGLISSPFTTTGISGPWGMAVSGSTLYISSNYAGTVTTYNTTTGVLINPSIVSEGSGSMGIALDGFGNLYVANNSSGTLDKYNASTGAPITLGFISMANVAAVAVDAAGNVYVSNDNGDGK
ncbi:MAG: hypothetical protein ABI254_02395, partial [Chthoniobacterales bacterium]